MSRRTATNPAPRKRQSRPGEPTRASKNCSKTRTRGVTVSREATRSDGWRERTTLLETLSTAAGRSGPYDVIIIGAGISGMYRLYRLPELGLSVRVFEEVSPEVREAFYEKAHRRLAAGVRRAPRAAESPVVDGAGTRLAETAAAHPERREPMRAWTSAVRLGVTRTRRSRTGGAERRGLRRPLSSSWSHRAPASGLGWFR